MTGSRKIRAGVIGVGYLGKHHARIYSAIPGVKLIGVSDINRDIGMEVAKNLGISFYESSSKLLKDVDAVSISTPTSTHYKLTKEVLLSGKHTLVEKPITEKVEEASEIIDLAKSKGLVLQIGHIERFNPAIIAVSKLINNPLFIEAQRIATYNERGTDVAVVLDLMVHDIDIILAFIHSKVNKIDAVGVPILSDEYDLAQTRLEFENGTIACLTSSRVSDRKERKIRFFQRDMFISVDYISHLAGVWRKIKIDGKSFIKKEKLEIIPKEPLRSEIESFVRCIKEGDTPIVTGEDGMKAIELAYRIIDNMDRHREIVGI